MKTLYRIVMQACYFLGMLVLIIAILERHVNSVYRMLGYEPRGVITFACALFLCALVSFAMLRVEAK